MELSLRVLYLFLGFDVWISTMYRSSSLSLTGKLLYPIVDLFVVHWEQLQAMYPKSHLVTTFVPRTVSAREKMTDETRR